MRTLFISLLALLLSTTLTSQVVINEVMINPPTNSTSAEFQSLVICDNPSFGREYIELYNTDPCSPADISCFVIGFQHDGFGTSDIGSFRFPEGTIIPPLGFISIGGPGSGATINLYDYCGTPNLNTANNRWYLQNSIGYIMLWNPQGQTEDAVWWRSSADGWGTNSDLQVAPNNNIAQGGSNCPSISSLQAPSSLPASSPLVNYAGSGGSMGTVIHRVTDGSPTWASGQAPSINACNGVCEEPLSLEITTNVTQPTCDAAGSISISVNTTESYTIAWTPNVSSSETATNLEPGEYTVTVSIDGCEVEETIELNNPTGCEECTESLTATLSTTPNSDCQECNYEGPSILINELMISPAVNDGSLSGFGGVSEGRGEWIELHNPNWCDPVDISCFYLGNSAPGDGGTIFNPAPILAGGYVIPDGTIIPPLGFAMIRGVNMTPVPPNLLVQNGGNVVELVVPFDITDPGVCVGPNASRLWFPNTGGWFAFYDANGIPQDAVRWGDPPNNVLDGPTCVAQLGPCNFSGTLPNYNAIPASNKSNASSADGGSHIGQSIRRIPDGGPWSGTGAPTYGECNDPNNCVGNTTVTECNGTATITMTSGTPPYSYQWNDPANQTGATALNLCAGIFEVIVTDANNCTETFTVEVIDDSFNWTFTISEVTCDGNDGSIAVEIDPAGNYTYNWSENTGITNNTSNTASNLAPGTYSLTVDGGGCEKDTVIVLEAPDCDCPAEIGTFTTEIIGISENNYVLCYGDEIRIEANGDYTPANDLNEPSTIIYEPGISWFVYSCPPTLGIEPDPNELVTDDPCYIDIVSNFDFSNLNDLSLINQYPSGTFTNNTIYFVPITMYNITEEAYTFPNTNLPCYDMGEAIAVQFLPEITTNLQEDCTDGSLTVTVNGGLPAVDGSQFSAQNLLPTSASLASASSGNGGNIIVTGLENGDEYSFEIIDGNGCPILLEGTFTGLENPDFNYDSPSYCQEDGSTTPTISGTLGGTFTATPEGLAINAANGTIDLTSSVAGDYTVTYTTPNNECGASSNVTISVYPTPIFSVSGTDPTACGVDDGLITISGLAPNEQYQVSYTNEGSPVGPIVQTTDPSGTLQITGLAPGNYSSFVIESSQGCTGENSDIITLEELETPPVNAGPDREICLGEEITLTADNPENANISWSGDIQDNQPFTPNSPSVTTYTVTAERNGCIATDEVIITVNPIPNVSAGADVVVCSGNTVVLTGQGADTYSWNNGVQNSVPFIPDATQVYTVTGTSSEGCSSSDEVLVTVEEVGALSFEADVLSGCVPVTTTLNNLSPLAGATCQWQVGGQTYTGCNDVNVLLNIAGCFDVTLQVTTQNGCVGQETYTDYICVDPYPVADFEADPMQVTNMNPLVNFTNTSSGASEYTWIFGDGSDITDEVHPSHRFPNEKGGQYITTLIATSDAGCSDTVSMLIRVLEDLIFYVPNAFTPDGDEHNQRFEPVFTSGFDPNDYNLLIFNRWGELIFESNDHRIGWDGTYGTTMNKPVKEGTYIWKIEFKTVNTDERQVHTGHVTILK